MVLKLSMARVSAELILWHVSQDTRQGKSLQPTDLWHGVVVVLDEPWEVLNGGGMLCVLDELAYFLLLDL